LSSEYFSNGESMRVLVLGHNGFIGREIVDLFQKQFPNNTVRGLSFPEIDLSTQNDVQKISPYFTQDTVVIMCAAVKKQWGDSLEIFNKNLQIIETLCGIIQDNPIQQLIYFSSAAVYGEDIHNTCINEDTSVQPRTFYGIGKFTAERLLWKVMSNQPNSTLTILRPPLIYGFGDESKGYGPAGFSEKLLHSQEITLWGDGSELREFLYVTDVARIVYEAACNPFRGVLNPVRGKSNSFQDVLDVLQKVTGRHPKLVRRDRSKEKVDNIFSQELLNQSFPDFTFTSLEKGLEEMLGIMKSKENS
jgi:UDP-glucose 4-epimerase